MDRFKGGRSPFGNIKGISRRTLKFHNTNLSTTVQHSYQALAIDEQRQPYWAVLWTSFTPNVPQPTLPPVNEERHIEQRWFSGAHCNLGGGYRNDLMPQRALAWMQGKAKECGLTFRSEITLEEDDLQQDLRTLPNDSYSEFLGGLWKLITFGHRYVRWVQSDRVIKKNGSVKTVNERIDLSVFHRCQQQESYRPPSLIEWSRRKRVDLEAIIAEPERYPHLWSPVADPGVEEELVPRAD